MKKYGPKKIAGVKDHSGSIGSIEQSEYSENIEMKYAGFWIRFIAQVLDLLLFALLTLPFALILNPTGLPLLKALLIGTGDLWVDIGLPIAAILICWSYRAGTPGKWLFKLQIVDMETHKSVNMKQSVIRMIGYFLAFLPFGAGYIWVFFDRKKQGLHDKLARTVVVYKQ